MTRNNKIATIHQPQYFPYLGFFNKIFHSNIFIVLDDVTNYKGDFTNRNKIKSPQGPIWLTVPLNRDKKVIKDIEIKNKIWVKKHLKSLSYNYNKSLFYETIMPSIVKIFESQNWIKLIDLNMKILDYIFDILDLNNEIILSSDLPKLSSGSERLVDLLKYANSKKYIAGPGSQNYLDENLFQMNNIDIIHQDYKEQEYQQMHGSFEPNLSILDSLFNVGPDGVKKLIK